MAFFATQHGHGQFTEIAGASLGGAARSPLQQFGVRENVAQPARRFAKRGRLLIQIDIDAAEKNRSACALVHVVERHGQVERDHERFMAELAQRFDESVVAKTIPAIHAARTGSDLDDVHEGRDDALQPRAGDMFVVFTFRRESRSVGAAYFDHGRVRAAPAELIGAALVVSTNMALLRSYDDAATGVSVSRGAPKGKASGTSANSSTALKSFVKSLSTSPDRQSVTSPARSGYLSVNSRKLKFGS